MYGHHHIYSRLGLNRYGLKSFSWSAEQEKYPPPVPVRAQEFGLARQVRPSCPASVHSSSTPRLNLVVSEKANTVLPMLSVYGSTATQNSRNSKLWKLAEVLMFYTRFFRSAYKFKYVLVPRTNVKSRQIRPPTFEEKKCPKLHKLSTVKRSLYRFFVEGFMRRWVAEA